MPTHPPTIDPDIGKKIWTRGHTEYGIVQKISHRYCAACGCHHSCYIVKWSDGSITKSCTKGVALLPEGDLQIE